MGIKEKQMKYWGLTTDVSVVTFITTENTEHLATVYGYRNQEDERRVKLVIRGATQGHVVDLRVDDFLWSHSTNSRQPVEKLTEVLFWKYPILIGDRAFRLRFANTRELRAFLHSL
jgi:hypothetical protein